MSGAPNTPASAAPLRSSAPPSSACCANGPLDTPRNRLLLRQCPRRILCLAKTGAHAPHSAASWPAQGTGRQVQRGRTLDRVALVSGGVASAQCAVRVHIARTEARCCTPARPHPRFRAVHQGPWHHAPKMNRPKQFIYLSVYQSTHTHIHVINTADEYGRATGQVISRLQRCIHLAHMHTWRRGSCTERNHTFGGLPARGTPGRGGSWRFRGT